MQPLTSIQVGDVLPERSYQPDTVQLFMYNAAIWNPHRIHYDQRYTTEVEGHEDIVVDGPLQGEWLTQVVLDWAGESAHLAWFRYANRGVAYVGEPLRATGTVSAIDGDRREVRLELGIFNADGECITPAEAIVRLPT